MSHSRDTITFKDVMDKAKNYIKDENELNNIKKDYVSGSTTVSALKGINLRFRDCEFVSILGQSGCGKTTMLNIIGGLDKYTSGDLKINGVSTKNYKDRDWDFYRNNSIGFVFQSYNLIPHQTVLSNVELALTLSGVSKAERKKRAIEALEKVGLGEQIHKKPNQMSGGQMQRVARLTFTSGLSLTMTCGSTLAKRFLTKSYSRTLHLMLQTLLS